MPIALYALIALCVAYCGLSQLVAWPICALIAIFLVAGILRDAFAQKRIHKNKLILAVGGSLPLAAIGSANTRATPSETLSLSTVKDDDLNNDPRALDHQKAYVLGDDVQTKTPHIEIVLAVLCFLSIVAIDVAQAGPINTWMLRLSLDLVLSLLAYRAIVHQKRSQQMQAAILTLVPLVALAQILEPFHFLTIVTAYSLIFWCFSYQMALLKPSTGATALAFIDKDADDTKRTPFAWALPWLTRAAGLLLVMAAIFLAFLLMPRWGGSMTQAPNAASQGLYPPQVALDKTGDIDLDPSLIFTAELPEIPDGHYWRFEVQESFDGIRWRAREGKTVAKKPKNTPPYGPYTIEFIREWRDRHVPTLEQTVELRWPEGQEQRPTFAFKRDDAGIWYQALGRPRSGSYAYEIFVDPSDTDMHRAPWPKRKKSIWPYDSTDYPRIESLAQELTVGAKTDREKAEKIRRFLSENYSYSLKRPKRNAPIVEDFLFSQKFGHCEVFSTTMAVLLASLDVPVRHITGFMSSEYRGGLNYIRATHAHSWLEVYDSETKRWRRYDPTPASQQPDVSWIVLINDAFARYKSLPLYRWMLANHLSIAAGLGILMSLLAIFGASWACLGLKSPKRGTLLFLLALVAGPASVYILAIELGLHLFTLGAMMGLLASLTFVGPWLWAAFANLEPIWISAHRRLMLEAKRRPKTQHLAEQSLGELWLLDFPTQSHDIKIFLQAYVAARYIPKHTHEGHRRHRPCLKLRQLMRIHLLGLKAIRALRASDFAPAESKHQNAPKA